MMEWVGFGLFLCTTASWILYSLILWNSFQFKLKNNKKLKQLNREYRFYKQNDVRSYLILIISFWISFKHDFSLLFFHIFENNFDFIRRIHIIFCSNRNMLVIRRNTTTSCYIFLAWYSSENASFYSLHVFPLGPICDSILSHCRTTFQAE